VVNKKLFQIFWSTDAEENLKNIYEHIKQDSQQNAEKVIANIIKLSKALSFSPLRYQECVELPTKTKIYRKLTYRPYKIIYRVKANRVEILSVFHSSQNPKRLSRLKKVKIK
jgi:plasmid stabilization system protein ParE